MEFKHIILAAVLSLLPLAVSAKDPVIRIVPQPERIELQKGSFRAIGAPINCDAGFDERSRAAVQDFAARLSLASGRISSFAIPVGIAASAEADAIKGFVFIHDTGLGSEEYRTLCEDFYL